MRSHAELSSRSSLQRQEVIPKDCGYILSLKECFGLLFKMKFKCVIVIGFFG